MLPLLQVTQACCRVGRNRQLRVDTLILNRGEHWCLFGPNGAGKSLLADLLSGQRRESSLYVDYSGSIDTTHQVFLVSFEEQQRLWQRDNRLDVSEFSADARDEGTTFSPRARKAMPIQNCWRLC